MMFELFAQGNNPNAGNPFAPGPGGPGGGAAGGLPPGMDMTIMIAIIIFALVMLVVGLAIAILFLRTLSRCLQRCSARNRTMEPGQVWLNLIPCFNIVWQFITVIRIEESIQNEFRDRGFRRELDYGKNLGMAYLILNLLGLIPYIGTLFSIAALVLFIMYWVKIAGISKEPAEGPSIRRERERDDEFDDRRDEPDEKPWRR